MMRHLDREFEGKNIQDITTWEVEKWKLKRKGPSSNGKQGIGLNQTPLFKGGRMGEDQGVSGQEGKVFEI